MARQKKTTARRRSTTNQSLAYKLPTERRKPVSDPWNYAYLITGEKKIGKTSFSIAGSEELVLQFDKPQISYEVREEVVETWADFIKVLKALESAAKEGKLPYNRIIIDGVGEWYAMCQTATCKNFGVAHPSEEGFARAWHHLRDTFTDAVNRILRLQTKADCGVVFIAHAEWVEQPIRGGGKVERLVPNLGTRCEEIVNGKVDGWFVYDYDNEDRVMVVRGEQTVGAGHRIDGRFLTPENEPIREIYMGTSANEAMKNFIAAFNNEWKYPTMEAYRASMKPQTRTRRSTRANKKGAKNG